MTNHYILAVDGGASKTVMTIRTAEGRELFSATSTSANYQAVGVEHVQHVFTGLLRSAAAHLPSLHIDVAVFAIAGVDTLQDKKIIGDIIQQSIAHSPFSFGHVLLENDVEATAKGLGKNNVSLLISGTGAICYSLIDDKMSRTGGWGHRIGDEGGGYWIGKQIAKAIFRAADRRNEATILTELILQGYQVQSTDELYNFIYSSDYTNSRLADFSSFLQQAVAQQDAVALKIAHDAVQELVLLITTSLNTIGYNNEAHTLFFNGGVLKHNPFILQAVTEEIQQMYPAMTLQLCDDQPIEAIFQRGLHAFEALQLR